MKIIFIHVALITSLCMAACSNTKHASDTSGKGSEALYASQWIVTEVDQKPVLSGEGKAARLAFTPGQVNRVSGNAGCNRLTGSFELEGVNKIKFSPIAATKMMCPNMDLETRFLNALQQVNSYSITGDTLLLLNGKMQMVKLISLPAVADSLEGTWDLQYISGRRIAFEGLYPDKKPFVSFNFAEHLLQGNTSCNGFSSKYVLKDQMISFADPLQTMMFCEGGGEEAFKEMLKKTTAYKADGNTLTFLAGDVEVMRFAKRQ